MLIMGWFDEDNTCNADLIWTAGLMWPLFLVVLFVWKTLECLIALGDRFKWIGKILHCIGMLFRPYTLGQEIYELFKKKNKKESEDDDD
jgi:hypothetical protein